MKISLQLLCFMTLYMPVSCSDTPKSGQQVLMTEGFSNAVVDAYWLYLPQAYDQKQKWPLIMYLHGGDESASPNPNTVKDGGPVRYMMDSKVVLPDSFIVVNPHMRTGSMAQRQWYKNANALIQIIDQVIANHNVDPDRIYLTGHSRGGHGAWGVAKRYPEKFAAILPIAGAISCKSNCEKIATLPMWIIHNIGDPVVPYDYSLQAVDFLERESAKSFTRLSNVNIGPNQRKLPYIFSSLDSDQHGGAGSKAYSSAKTYQWLLDKRRQLQ